MSLCGIIQDCAEHSTTIWGMIWWSRMEPLWRQNRTVPRPSPSAGEWSKIPIDTWNLDPNRSRSSKSHFKRILSIKFIYLTYRICYKNFRIKFVRHLILFFFSPDETLFNGFCPDVMVNSNPREQFYCDPIHNLTCSKLATDFGCQQTKLRGK